MSLKLFVTVSMVLFLAACGKSVDRDYLVDGSNVLNQACDPLDGQPLSSQQLFRATLALLPAGTTADSTTNIHTFWNHDTAGNWIPKRSGGEDLFTKEVNVPNRNASEGFTLSTLSTPIMNPDNTSQVLSQWFSIQFKSNLVLGDKAAGKYHIAALADDGVKVEIDTGTGFRYLSAANSQRSETLVCGLNTNFVELDSNSRFPIRITYFQGPQPRLSLVLLMKKVEDADINQPVDAKCGQGGAKYWFDADNSSQPTSEWTALMGRGWEVLSAENLFLAEGLKTCE